MKNRRSWCLATLGREEGGGLSELTWLGTEDKPGLRRTLSSELSIKKDKILNRTLRQDSTTSPRHWGWTLWEGRVTVGEGGQVLNTQVPLKEVFFSDNKSIRCGAKRWTVSSMFSQNLSKTSGICEAWSAMLTAEWQYLIDANICQQCWLSSAALNNSNIWRIWSSKSGTCEAWSATLTAGWQS